MFFPPKRQTIIAMLVAIAGMAISTQAMAWQNSEFKRLRPLGPKPQWCVRTIRAPTNGVLPRLSLRLRS